MSYTVPVTQPAEADWRVGAHLVRRRKTRHGLFFLHLAFEKILKSHACGKTGAPAPRTHSLPLLAERAGVELSDDQRTLLVSFDRYNIEGRYPETWSHLPSGREMASLVRKAREVYQCLVSQS